MAIDYSVEAGVGFIVLNRPPANAYDATMVAELLAPPPSAPPVTRRCGWWW